MWTVRDDSDRMFFRSKLSDTNDNNFDIIVLILLENKSIWCVFFFESKVFLKYVPREIGG